MVHESEVEFYTNLVVLDDSVVSSSIHGIEIVFDCCRLGEVLQVPTFGVAEYVWIRMGTVYSPPSSIEGHCTTHKSDERRDATLS